MNERTEHGGNGSTTIAAPPTIATEELAPTDAGMRAVTEVQAAIIMAIQNPRDEDRAIAKILRACKRPGFAALVAYSFPRGGGKVTGPSIYLAREMAKCWGNINHGYRVVRDDDDVRTIKAFAWDLESNNRVEAEDTFKKVIQRKVSGVTQWVTPDERDLRELTNRRAAILKRNCLLELLPEDIKNDALERAQRTLAEKVAQDPDAERKKLIDAFDSLNVSPAKLRDYLGCDLAEASPEQIADLRGVYASIRDGNSTWSEYVNGSKGEADAPAPEGEKEAAPDLSDLEATDDDEGLPVKGLDSGEQQGILKGLAANGIDLTAFNVYMKATYGTPVLAAIEKSKLPEIEAWIEAEGKRAGKTLPKAAITRIQKAREAAKISPERLAEWVLKTYGLALDGVAASEETEILKWISSSK